MASMEGNKKRGKSIEKVDDETKGALGGTGIVGSLERKRKDKPTDKKRRKRRDEKEEHDKDTSSP
ncbi:hypothetical protein DCC39_15260 [Pueribacillus theae]|uniref:Uncharacterized protein n=1 Tax=Pueribacillus theae TaxID=2171751 RepID=A0A2U1JTD5_9BACI|nr:hypothetical protein [Pueribacillus theae]PWA08143.1 hypothetical protein DCC39_15260 [Pueribacillus theae]